MPVRRASDPLLPDGVIWHETNWPLPQRIYECFSAMSFGQSADLAVTVLSHSTKSMAKALTLNIVTTICQLICTAISAIYLVDLYDGMGRQVSQTAIVLYQRITGEHR